MFSVSLMDLGFVTHGVHANSRLVELPVHKMDGDTVTLMGPASQGIYPPGPGWLFILVDGVPSKGRSVMIGDGTGPVVDDSAQEK
jgi:hypothetical protein